MARTLPYFTGAAAQGQLYEAERRDLVGALLLTGIDSTDRFAARFPLVMLLGLLMLIGLFGLLEEALG